MVTNTRSPQITGDDQLSLGMAVFHSTFEVLLQFKGGLISADNPLAGRPAKLRPVFRPDCAERAADQTEDEEKDFHRAVPLHSRAPGTG